MRVKSSARSAFLRNLILNSKRNPRLIEPRVFMYADGQWPPLPGGFVSAGEAEVEQRAADGREERTGGCGEAHGQQRLWEEARHQIRARDTDEHNGEDAVQERKPRFAARAEIAAEAEVDTGEHAVEDIAAQIVRAGSDRRRVGREQADDTRWRVLSPLFRCTGKQRQIGTAYSACAKIYAAGKNFSCLFSEDMVYSSQEVRAL